MNAMETQAADAAFTRALIEATRSRRSWRERLQWIRDQFLDPAFAPTPGRLTTIAIYLRLLGTGELRCEEDGRHFRPNHHAEAAQQIETALEQLTAPETAWILRRIYPYLPSWGEAFRRSEPLTRIRDIAHRNDLPHDLKTEIKHRLQNKLHRCAGPEDLRTSEEILQRITAPGAAYAADFVREFHVFHSELQEFFNATALDGRLRALADTPDTASADSIRHFLSLKARPSLTDQELLDLLQQLTALRQHVAQAMNAANPRLRSQLRLADIGLEDYAFAQLSACANRLENLSQSGAWETLLRALAVALDNLRLSLIEPDECAALRSEITAWAQRYDPQDRFHLLRVLATLSRARRLAEDYTDRINRLFPPRVQELSRELGIADHAIKVFSEGDLRGHVIFQLSRLVDLGLEAARRALRLPPWEAIVPGEASGALVCAAAFAEVEGRTGPLVLVLERADGDAEIPEAVKGLLLGHPMPHLSHLGVRARQARIPFAACTDRASLGDFASLAGKSVSLRVAPDGPVVREISQADSQKTTGETERPSVAVPEAVLAREIGVVALDQATPATCGAKAAGAQRLLELAQRSAGLFRAPRGLAVPFGVMELALDAVPAARQEYALLQERVPHTPREELGPLLDRLRALVGSLPLPDTIGQAVSAFFPPETRLAVRSSANGEDLEHLAGAGLYDSVVNVPLTAVPAAIAQVWASLWTRRATVSRLQAGIPHARIHMAVLLQELVVPDLSFILHTVNPLTGNRQEALVELAVGLGEVLASAALPGTPYRMVCDRASGAARLEACATFSFALRPAPEQGASGTIHERLAYERVALSADPGAAERLGKRLVQIAALLEEQLGRAQDAEGVCVGEDVYVVQARPQQGL